MCIRDRGYTGDQDDSATMNIWLHKEVMKQLAANGGIVPAGLAAVSYTHLDVYKRQTSCIARKCSAKPDG